MLRKVITPDKEMLKRLEQTVEQLGCGLIYDNTPGNGGFVQYKDKKRFIINRFLSTQEKINIICENLRKMDLQNIYLLPVVRKAVFGNNW